MTGPTRAPTPAPGPGPRTGPRIDVVGLGPAGPELMTDETLGLITGSAMVFLRTSRHPAAAVFPDLASFDDRYESEPTFDAVYAAIVAELVAASRQHGAVVYAVPGSPTVAERTVGLLREDPAVTSGEVSVVVHPALSFLDVAFGRLGIDPIDSGVRMVDAESFASSAAGERGPLLVAQCWSRALLSEIKLSVEPPPGAVATVLYHLGLDDERVWDVAWDDLDRSFQPDHLTSLWIGELAAPVGSELMRLDELMHTLREQCPWDREQTHGSLARHLLEESYEVLEAIDNLATIDAQREADAGRPAGGEPATPEAEERAVAHLEEELGDLLFQVYFHATLAAESGRFTLADVARGVHDKLVARHPHVFGDLTAASQDQIASNWETLKMAEKNRTTITEGIPAAMPALALAAKLQRKALAVGMKLPGPGDEAGRLVSAAGRLAESDADAETGIDRDTDPDSDIGELLFSLVNLARAMGVDPESALRAKAAAFRAAVDAQG
ncbi:MAG TPA: MazG nucleotide pyrophosphohydrolase domain-containing protein [Acidimicrobiales bacterium]|nr:MazG nucleotide pyrophosphohydrolase domain-containing protein [Acidimicrobiales bacterium]